MGPGLLMWTSLLIILISYPPLVIRASRFGMRAVGSVYRHFMNTKIKFGAFVTMPQGLKSYLSVMTSRSWCMMYQCKLREPHVTYDVPIETKTLMDDEDPLRNAGKFY